MTTYSYQSGCNRLVNWGTNGENTVQMDVAGCVTNLAYAGLPTRSLSWNGQYQVTSIATNGVSAESYGFDALGRRVYVAQGTTTNWFIYDGIQVVAEVNGSGQLQKSYTWGPGIDNLLALTVYSGGSTSTYYALTDHLGTVHALADSSGSIVESYRFDAWGRVLGVYNSAGQPISQSAIGNRYLWQGREYSWKTGLYHFRARWYDPITGRWLSNDPIGISGGLNQYVAFNNAPTVFRDPSGLCVEGNTSTGRRPFDEGLYRYLRENDPIHPYTQYFSFTALLNLKIPGVDPAYAQGLGHSPWTSLDRRIPKWLRPWIGADPHGGFEARTDIKGRPKFSGRYGAAASILTVFSTVYEITSWCIDYGCAAHIEPDPGLLGGGFVL